MNAIPEVLSSHTCELGEGPVWDAGNNRLYWVDILNGILHWHNFSDHTNEALAIGQKIGSVALAGDGRLVAALETGFYFINIHQKCVSAIVTTEKEIEGNRFNDGKCDPAGRFWAGSMSMGDEPHAGKLYMLNTEHQVKERIADVGCSNGLAWSADFSTFYFIDSLSSEVVAYDYDMPSGEISNRRVIIRFTPEEGIPDGMTIDSEGALWIALWNGWRVNRYSPHDGKLLDQILLPVSLVTSCTFGGQDLTDLYITSAKTGLSDADLQMQPLAGSLFVVKNCGYKGELPFAFKE